MSEANRARPEGHRSPAGGARARRGAKRRAADCERGAREPPDGCKEEPEIRLDRDGQFFFRGAPCVRREITDVFFEKLEEDGAGGYRIRLGSDLAPVAVEEAPLRVWNLMREDGRIVLVLDGGLTDELDRETLRFEGDVPWCRARGLPARFTPTAALSLATSFPELLPPGSAP
ncbi:hypothetical protein HY251_05850 [bacterium]|nr:hypothetical protein [bacterium]